MNKINKAYNILINRLPFKYHIPIKIYKKVSSMLQVEAIRLGIAYKELIQYYNNYLNDEKKATYIKHQKRIKNYNAFDICGLGGNPNLLAEDNLKNKTIHVIGFFLLHEIGHNVIENDSERNCDLFAKRWINKIAKENLIRNKYD